MKLFVTAAAGTEGALKEELRELRFAGVKGDRGGVRLSADAHGVARICLSCRTAVRVLVEVARFACPDEDALYEGVAAVEWDRWLTPERTLAVSAISRRSRLTHTNYIAQRTKDAVVDRQRARHGRRSSVDRSDPDVGIFVHLANDRAGVFLDASGGSLHLRGWRTESGAAPLKETLAAAILRLAGWDRSRPLLDPMCGSGTFPIEADQWARSVPPQATSRRFGFTRWADHDELADKRLRALREDLHERAAAEGPPCLGSDRDGRVLAQACRNAERARSRATFRVGDLSVLRSWPAGHVVTNPPYGRRLEADRAFWSELGRALEGAPHHRISVLLPRQDGPARLLSRRPSRSHRLFNGRLQCSLVTWDADDDGSRRDD